MTPHCSCLFGPTMLAQASNSRPLRSPLRSPACNKLKTRCNKLISHISMRECTPTSSCTRRCTAAAPVNTNIKQYQTAPARSQYWIPGPWTRTWRSWSALRSSLRASYWKGAASRRLRRRCSTSKRKTSAESDGTPSLLHVATCFFLCAILWGSGVGTCRHKGCRRDSWGDLRHTKLLTVRRSLEKRFYSVLSFWKKANFFLLCCKCFCQIWSLSRDAWQPVHSRHFCRLRLRVPDAAMMPESADPSWKRDRFCVFDGFCQVSISCPRR